MIRLALGGEPEREAIYRARHGVYAAELQQYPLHPDGFLMDHLDPVNAYIVALDDTGALLGFISLTPPTAGIYSLDRYFPRTALPFPADTGLWEVRLLTILEENRGSILALLLMHAALRWVEEAGGTRIAGIGRVALKPFYRKAGLTFHGQEVRSGAVTFELMSAPVAALTARSRQLQSLMERTALVWELPFPRFTESCFHGGAFFGAIGTDFARLDQRHAIINADVLDAWFDPAPEVIAALTGHLPWLLKTSPPTHADGLIAAVAKAREIPSPCLAPGAGSSDLIFRAFTHWLTAASRVLLPDPAYGEYAHVLERVIGCTVTRLPLERASGWQLPLVLLAETLATGAFDLCVLIHPNNPTGTLTSRAELEPVLAAAPARTRFWIDEAYIDYVGVEHSLETYAHRSLNTAVCKSLSKVYALSGARVAYLCGPPALVADLRRRTPPWQVSLPAQVAATHALAASAYYQDRWQETHALRRDLARALGAALPAAMVQESVANWLLLSLPPDGLSAAEVGERASRQGLFVRDPGRTSARFGSHTLRVAVKDAATNEKITAILAEVLRTA